jgi:hypothetical protein
MMHGGLAILPGGEAIALEQRHWDTPTVIRIAGCEQATLLQWRRKYGFLGGAEPGRGRVGYRHSVVDICLICTAVAMIQHGIDPVDACSDDPFLRLQIEGLITGELRDHILGFHRGSERRACHVSYYFLGADQTLGEVINTPDGIITLLDLRKIIDRVFKALHLRVDLRGNPSRQSTAGGNHEARPRKDRAASR